MRKQFVKDKYRGAWFKGFGLMRGASKKYGIRVPFVPTGPFEIVWNFTYKCNLRCKHCYEDEVLENFQSCQRMRPNRP